MIRLINLSTDMTLQELQVLALGLAKLPDDVDLLITLSDFPGVTHYQLSKVPQVRAFCARVIESGLYWYLGDDSDPSVIAIGCFGVINIMNNQVMPMPN